MKKIIFTFVLAVAAMNSGAQLVVDSLGNVGIGTETPLSNLSIGTSGGSDVAIQCDAQGKRTGMYVMNFTNDSYETCGGSFRAVNNTGHCFGGRSVALGSGNMNLSKFAIGLAGYADYAWTSVGLYGGKNGGPSTTNFAGVYGSETVNLPTFSYSGKYAGYFRGKVRVTNGIYATVLSPTASTSPSGQIGTTILSDRGESVTDKLIHVQTLQFLRQYPPEDLTGDILEEEEPEPDLSAIQYGLDAEQLKAVYPELVYEDANGNVSINYVEMVPLLVQSINELKSELAELKGTSGRKARAETTAIEDNVSDIDMVRMDQNKPNPFSESTVITLNIPQQAQTASIFIYDMSGKQIQSLPVTERGETNITVYARDLTAGMYIYTLIVDGKAEVTRRMIVSNV